MQTVIGTFASHKIGGANVEAVPTYFTKRPGQTMCSTLRAAWKLATQRNVVAHVHLSQGGSFVREGALVCLSRLMGHQTIANVHGSNFATFAARHRRLVGTVLNASHAVCVLSQEAKDSTRRASRTQAHLIPNPIECDDDSPPADKTAAVVLFAGEISERKGADVLFRAWPSVLREVPDAEAIVIGPVKMDLADIPNQLKVLPPTSNREQVRQLLRSARVAALPSRAEAMPMFLLEAQAARRPFVATPVGSISTLAKEGGITVPVGDHELLAQAIVRFLTHTDEARLAGDSGQAACQRDRGIEVISSKYEALYENWGADVHER